MNRKTNQHFTAVILFTGCLFFSTGATAGAIERGEGNLSSGKPCKAFSSDETHGWSVAKLTDGVTDARGWSSKAFPEFSDHRLYPEFIQVDLGSDCALREVILYPRNDGQMTGKGFPRDFTIEVCSEGEPWRVVVEKHDYPAPEDGKARSFLLQGAVGRYVKIEATMLREGEQGDFRFQLAEISVLGERVAGAELVFQTRTGVGPDAVTRLRCENRDNPAGIDVARPRLSWWMQSDVRGRRQTAWRILVASGKDLIMRDEGDFWDSKRTEGNNSVAVVYDGKALRSGRTYWWKVKLWDEGGKETAWSEPAFFLTGKFRPEDWQGQWIGADPVEKPDAARPREEVGSPIHVTSNPGHAPVYLRKEISVTREVRRATVFFSGLGFSELYVDGHKVGDYVIGPGFTNYNKRTPYLAFDVTGHFAGPGLKALGVILVDGWYGNGYGHGFEKNVYVDRPKLLLDLHLEYTDGTEEVIVSDGSWKWSGGDIISSGIVYEDIDRRQAQPGWDRAGYHETGWRPAVVVKGPDGRMVHQKESPVRIVQEIRPVSMKYDEQSGTSTYEFGREFNGWVRFRTKGPAGTAITMSTIPTVNLPRTSRFILAGTGDSEVYEPRFFHAGMRKVVIKGTARPPAPGDLTGCLVSMSWPPAGSFRCSDDVANWLYDATRRTVEAYTTFLPNDPVREWKAWTEDIENMFRSSVYLYDSQTMYERWQWDMTESQGADGNIPNVTPGAYFDGYNSPWWGGCVVWLPWYWYQYYGDQFLLKESYPAMKRYVSYLGKAQDIPGEYAGNISADGMQDWGLADWCPVEETPRVLINTPAYYLYADIVSRTAAMLGLSEDARKFGEVARAVRAAFNRHYFDPATGIYGIPGTETKPGHPIEPVGGQIPHKLWWSGNRCCTQAGQVMPLALGMVPPEQRPAAEQALLKEISAHGNRLSTGFVSTPYLLEVMADLAPETGYAMTSAQDYPSWYGMTAGSNQDLLKETWAGGQALMPSLGGNIVNWQIQALAGIRPDPSGPGFAKIFIKPTITDDLHWAEAQYNSVHGQISSKWRRRGEQLVMDVTIPANTTATIFVPTTNVSTIMESGNQAASSRDVKFLREENGSAVFEVPSGIYQFRSAFAKTSVTAGNAGN